MLFSSPIIFSFPPKNDIEPRTNYNVHASNQKNFWTCQKARKCDP